MPTPRAKSGVGGRLGISALTLSPTPSESKNGRLSPAASRRLQVSQSPGLPHLSAPRFRAQALWDGLLQPRSWSWLPERRRGESSPASPVPEAAAAAAAGARLCEGGGHGTGGGGGQRGEGEEPQGRTAARTNPEQAGSSRAEAGPSALQPLRVGRVG